MKLHGLCTLASQAYRSANQQPFWSTWKPVSCRDRCFFSYQGLEVGLQMQIQIPGPGGQGYHPQEVLGHEGGSPNFGVLCFQTLFFNAETTILIKFAFWRGLGRGEIEGKLSKTAVFLGKFHDNKIWKICKVYCQKNVLSFRRLLTPIVSLLRRPSETSTTRAKCQAPPCYGSGRYGFGVFVLFCATGALWERIKPFSRSLF